MFGKPDGDGFVRARDAQNRQSRTLHRDGTWKNRTLRAIGGLSLSVALVASMSFSGVVPSFAAGTNQADETVTATAEPSASLQTSPSDEETSSAKSLDEVSEPTAESELAESSRDGSSSDIEAASDAPEAVDEDVAERQADVAVSPLSLDANGNSVVKTPTRTSTIIKVTKGDVRTAATTIASNFSTGARFQLYYARSNGSIGDAVTEPWGTCQIEAGDNGICYFSVPNTNNGGANRTKFYIRELAPAAGSLAAQNYDVLSKFNTGANGSTESTYQYRTKTLTSNSTISMPADHDGALGTADASSGTWANSIKNPTLPVTCELGIKVALVFDLSGSVKNAGAADTLGNAGKGFVDALSGTNSSVALFSFGDTSPRAGTTNVPGLRNIDSGTNSTRIKNDIQNYINSFSGWGYTSNGTNWDAGLWATAQNAKQYDLVVVLTDGNPTFSGINSTVGPGNSTYFRELEAAVFSANAVKAQGARIINVGIGEGLNADNNLAATSGPVKYSPGASLNTADYLNVGWEALQPLLEDFAKSISCQAGVTVTKKVKDLGGTTKVASGWTIDAATQTGNASLTPETSQQTNTDGEVKFDLGFSKPDGKETVQIAETQQDGYKLSSVICTINDRTVQVTQSEKFTLALTVGDKANCVITNEMKPSTPTVVKTSNPVSGTEIQPGEEIEYKLTFSTEGTFSTDIDYVDHLEGVLDDADLVAGSITADPGLNAVLSGKTIKITGAVSPGKPLNVTYKVKAKTENFGDGKAINFVVPNGQTPPEKCGPEDTTCTEHPIAGNLAVEKSSDPESGTSVLPGQRVNYTLNFANTGASEVDVNYIDYLADVLDDANFVEGSLETGQGLDATLVGDQIQITGKLKAESAASVSYSVTIKESEFGNGIAKNFLVPDGEDPVCDPEQSNCTEHPVLGSVTWEKIDGGGNTLAGSEWELSGPGADGQQLGIEDCIEETAAECTGADKDPAAGAFKLTGLTWGEYTLVETKAPAGYVLDDTEHRFTIGTSDDAKLIWDLGDMENEQRPALALPLTGGMGTQSFIITGSIALMAALGVVAWRRRKAAAQG